MNASTNADLMTTGLGDDGQLASMGPLLGLEGLARGEIDRDTYTRTYGHRGPHEFEVSLPRPAEDTRWIDRQLAALGTVEEDAALQLARQTTARAAAWDRLAAAHPRRMAGIRAAVDTWAASARLREAARTEIARVFWLLRTFVLRGEVSGAGEELFFLSSEEILAVLGGDRAPLAAVPAPTPRRVRGIPRASRLPDPDPGRVQPGDLGCTTRTGGPTCSMPRTRHPPRTPSRARPRPPAWWRASPGSSRPWRRARSSGRARSW